MALRVLLVAALLLTLPLAHAQRMYRWVDKDGNVSYQDHPPPSEASQRIEERSMRVPRDSAGAASADDPASRAPVVLYSVPKCSGCDAARAHLQRRNVPFSEKNVESDAKLQSELTKRSGALSVPTVTVGEKVMKGYVDTLLDGELDSAGYPKAEAATP
jgi:glutaredoxin